MSVVYEKLRLSKKVKTSTFHRILGYFQYCDLLYLLFIFAR